MIKTDFTDRAITALQILADKRLENARAVILKNASDENYICHMTAAMVLMDLAEALMKTRGDT